MEVRMHSHSADAHDLYWSAQGISVRPYFLASRILGQRTAMIAAALLAFDPSYILHIRLDWGPVALMMFFKVGSLYFLAEFARTRKLFYLKVAALFLGLGLYDKANFLWYLLALPLATFV